MKYESALCSVKADSQFIAYKANRRFKGLLKLLKFNSYIELPMNVISSFEVNTYFFIFKGLSLTIYSGSNGGKIKRLRPINITCLPAGMKRKLVRQMDRHMTFRGVLRDRL